MKKSIAFPNDSFKDLVNTYIEFFIENDSDNEEDFLKNISCLVETANKSGLSHKTPTLQLYIEILSAKTIDTKNAKTSLNDLLKNKSFACLIMFSEFLSENNQINLTKKAIDFFQKESEQKFAGLCETNNSSSYALWSYSLARELYLEYFQIIQNIFLLANNLSDKTRRFLLDQVYDNYRLFAPKSFKNEVPFIKSFFVEWALTKFFSFLSCSDKNEIKEHIKNEKKSIFGNKEDSPLNMFIDNIGYNINKNLDLATLEKILFRVLDELSEIPSVNPDSSSRSIMAIFDTITYILDLYDSNIPEKKLLSWREKCFPYFVKSLKLQDIMNLFFFRVSLTMAEKSLIIGEIFQNRENFLTVVLDELEKTEKSLVTDKSSHLQKKKIKLFYTLFLAIMSERLSVEKKIAILEQIPRQNRSHLARRYVDDLREEKESVDAFSFMKNLMFFTDNNPVKFKPEQTKTIMIILSKYLDSKRKKEEINLLAEFLTKTGKNLLVFSEEEKTPMFKQLEMNCLKKIGVSSVFTEESRDCKDYEQDFVDIF